MKLKKIVAAIAAAAVAVSTMAISAFAIKDYPNGYTLDLIAEGYTVTDVYGFTFNISGDIDSGLGGGVGFNSATTGWESHEWGNADAGKEINASGGKVTFTKDAPVFAESDATDPTNPYAQIWMQQWWGSDITIDSVEVLGADGVVLTPAAKEEAPAETEAPAEEAPAEETTEAPAEEEAVVAEEVVEEEIVEEEVVEEVVEEAPEADTTTEATATGNVAVASIATVMALAGAAALVSKKRN